MRSKKRASRSRRTKGLPAACHFQTRSSYNKKRNSFLKEFLQLGYKDSNLEMTESESVALPFGDSPMSHNKMYSTR